jgi:hypothetical protein
MASPKDICSGFASVAERQAVNLRAVARRDPSALLACYAIEAKLPTTQICAACDVAGRAAEKAVEAAATLLARDAGTDLRNLSAICLPHLRLLVGKLGNAALVKAVLLRQADLLDRLSEDMRHFALKRDGLQRHLTTKEEVAAGERALRVLVGSPRAQMGPAAPHRADNVTSLACAAARRA